MLNPFPRKLLHGAIHWIISLSYWVTYSLLLLGIPDACVKSFWLCIWKFINDWKSSEIFCSAICCCGLVAQLCLTLLQPHGRQPSRLLCPWDLPGKDFGVGYCALLQGFLPTLGWNLHLLRWQASSLPLSHQGSPRFTFSGFSNNVFMFTPIKFIFKRIYQIFSMVRKFDQPVGWKISFIRRWYWT